jgi:peroxiredoxin
VTRALAGPASWWRTGLAAATILLLPGPAVPAEPLSPSLLAPLRLVGYSKPTRAPALDGDTVDGGKISSASLQGKVVLVNFWASWCLECGPEMEALERLHRDLAPQGLAVVGVNARENAPAARRYAQQAGLSFLLVLDPGGAINERYGVVGIPTTFLVARDGRAVAFGVGPRDWGGPAARVLLETLLAEGHQSAP